MCVNSKFKPIGCDSASCCFDELSAGQSGYLLGAIADLSGLRPGLFVYKRDPSRESGRSELGHCMNVDFVPHGFFDLRDIS
jgi:hypothetical protein